MHLQVHEPPRRFRVGREQSIELQDCARVELDADELITLHTASGAEFDIVGKEWGFYATPSLNDRVGRGMLRPALTEHDGKYFVLLIELGCEPEFEQYCRDEGMGVVAWLDDPAMLQRIGERCAAERSSPGP